MTKRQQPSKQPTAGSGHNVLLLSCMDLRLLDEIVDYMHGRNLTDRYDHVILAGAALGVVHAAHGHWAQTFWDHLALARELHNVEEVHIIEHRECGAYQKLLGLHLSDDPDAERQKHAKAAHALEALIHLQYPSLTVRSFLMDLKGHVTPL
jgi:carbonic anhydrase